MGVLKQYRNIGIATELLKKNENLPQLNKLKSVTVKAYDVSQDMLRLLLKRGYIITDIQLSSINSKFDVKYLELKI